MRFNLSRALCASTALATGLLISSAAMAQSTGTSVLEELVVTGATGPTTLGGVVAVEAPKSRVSVDQDFLSRQAPGNTVLDQINILPGVNFTSNDAYGSAGGDITLRGFDSNRIALLQDGVPLNDSGNYAIYPNQQLDSDLISRVDVNLGTTDVDSPTAAAAGGTINYVTRTPSDEMGIRAEVGMGTDNFQRYYTTVETGQFGPFGTKAWISGLYSKNDIQTPSYSSVDAPGQIEKKQFNARIYQDLGGGDFVSLIAHYNQNRNNFIRRVTLAQFQREGVTATNTPDTTLVYEASCVRPTPGAGVQNEATTPTGFTARCANYVGNNINPSNTGNIRGQGSFHLTDNLILTVDPSFQYTIANGGGRTIFPENDLQFGGPVDLNGDGDTVDRVLLYWPNTTNTRRYSITSSLIYRFSPSQSFRVAYTYDYARHRQTGQATQFDQNGDPLDVFGGKDGFGPAIDLPNGDILRRRDRFSIATLNQFSAEYRGRFLDERLLVNAGLRMPTLKRDLNNYCYQRDTFNAYCTMQTPTAVPGTNDGSGRPLYTFPVSSANSNAGNRYAAPRAFDVKYDDVLPNVGVAFDVTSNQQIYASYAETLSAPRTDDLYGQLLSDVQPEIGHAYDLGWRYTSPTLLISVAGWYNDFSNRIERAFDEAANIAFSINVGDVTLKGIDGQVRWQPEDYVSFYASASYVESEIKNNIPGETAGTTLPTAGRSLYETPKLQGAVRVDYDVADWVSLGVQGKFVGGRYTNLTNTEKVPGYALWDLDARFKLAQFNMENTYLQVNVRNLFDEVYLGDLSVNPSGTGQAQPGYGRSLVATLHVEF
ncbi:TonB-dependent receptor [Phenylobacterium deserti]|uniref:TonB-dependent receptor n=1 Tax=Phenylobacterium deserti TaxID=1914756 RepID=A0A328ARQ3_9CAUL|nr:TonB-dependent receptor [Phenylobacterium deserti]RAK57722.1 TonB-dependent receptor [Phenylobacterium deserti]